MPNALILGASRGLGLGLAGELARRGWTVTGTVRREGERMCLSVADNGVGLNPAPGREPGIGLAAAKFLTDSKVAIIGADTWAIEAVPHENKEMAFPVHQWDLTKNGVYHLENLDLEEIAATGEHEFCFVFSPLRLKGATGSPGNPIALR